MSLLIEPEVLATLLNDKKVLPFDARFSLSDKKQGRALYRQGHIPGAVFADLEEDLSGPVIMGRTGRHPLPEPQVFSEKLRQWGIKKKTHVVVYDDGSHAMAARAWWQLRWAGVKKVFMLHGGMKAWQAGRYPVTKELPERTDSDFEPKYSGFPVMEGNELMANLGTDKYTLIDARGHERFTGEIEPLDAMAGHIPGAVCHPFMDNMDDDGRFLSKKKLRKRFSSLIKEGSAPVLYCGSGVTACHNLFAMEYAGVEGGILYPGSWSDWITDPERPIATEE